MVMACRNKMMMPYPDHNIKFPKSPLYVDLGRASVTCSFSFSSDTERSIRTIQGLLNKVELSVSAYDTTWAAMLPSGDLKKQEVGSWSLDSKDCQLVEDSISSRLGSLLSLRKWRGDELVNFVDEELFFSTVSPMFTNVTTILELYKASQLIIYPNEEPLERIQAWTTTYLKDQLLNQSINDKKLHKEVEFTLKNYHGTLARVLNRRCIELYDIDKHHILKTSYSCQALHQAELQILERWYEKNELQSSRVPKRVLQSSYFMITADAFEPELSDARISYAQTCVLVTVVDDLFDNCAPREELVNLIQLVKKWDKNSFTQCCSKQVKLFLLALYNTVDELAEKAFVHQGRCIKQDLISMWQELLEGMLTELDWWRENSAPTIDEYLSVGRTTIGAKICVLTGAYFLGPKLSEDILNSEEMKSLWTHASTVGRLLNDIQTQEKELEQRKPNIVSMHVARGNGVITMEEATTRIEETIERGRRQLLQMVLQTNGSQVPRVCKDFFWTTCKICFYLYKFTNEYDSPKEIVSDAKKIIYEPIKLPKNIF
ncbi:class I diterpene synthase 2, chloroplastic isoform X2 [Coffea arabica]|uniref:Class I diterpene synthase 2, chloroplastic isoform X2 n=1 Tax=Coffea arabica TaxID=13443 RepID=A0ABM4VG68_COFAR